MKRKHLKIISVIFCLTALFASPLYSQILEVIEDYEPTEYQLTKNIVGSTLSGTSGLVTLPAPDFDDSIFSLSFKRGISKSYITDSTGEIGLQKDEKILSLRCKPSTNLEISAHQLDYRRTSDPTTSNLTFDEKHLGFGAKYSGTYDDNEFAMGFTFTPMTASELNLADIEQIENLRNIYLTLSEKITDSIKGYLNFSHSFTQKQKVDFGNGIIKTIDRKNILSVGGGVEYQMFKYGTMFAEAKFGNYRDIFIEDDVRYRVHGGFRLGTNNISAEILGVNLTEKYPTAVFGANIAY